MHARGRPSCVEASAYFGFGRSLSPFKGCAHRLGLHTSPSAALKCIGSQRGPSFRIGSRSSGHEGFLPLHRLGPVPPASRVPARASASRAPCPGVYCTGTLQVLSKLIDVVDGGQSRSHKSSVRQMFENTQDKTHFAEHKWFHNFMFAKRSTFALSPRKANNRKLPERAGGRSRLESRSRRASGRGEAAHHEPQP